MFPHKRIRRMFTFERNGPAAWQKESFKMNFQKDHIAFRGDPTCAKYSFANGWIKHIADHRRRLHSVIQSRGKVNDLENSIHVGSIA